ncbi:DNA cytosine methyltransferase, partial [Vibrio fluvialis]|nr:DNA cytosine methyltransferase [Vibrio fluvialis]
LEKFVLNSDNPFIVSEENQTPFITEHANASNQRNMPADEPLRTICAQVKGGHFALVTAFMTKFRQGSVGYEIDSPVHTITSGGEQKRPGTANTQALVTSHMVKMRGTNIGHGTDEPVHTISAGGFHIGEVRAFLLKYYGTNYGHALDQPVQTITTKHRFGLVTVQGEQYQVVDIGMRMLEPHELFAAQGFPEHYQISHDSSGKKLSKAKQVARCGNAVCPPVAQALVEANVGNRKLSVAA